MNSMSIRSRLWHLFLALACALGLLTVYLGTLHQAATVQAADVATVSVPEQELSTRVPSSEEMADENTGVVSKSLTNINFTEVWLDDRTENTLGLAWGDMDGDGDLDLAIATEGDLYGGDGEVNRLYRNEGGGVFSELPDALGNREDVTKSLAWGDMDGDGDLDLAVGNTNAHDGWPTYNQLFRNDGGVFNEVPNALSAWGYTHKLAWGDMDDDGDLDLVTADTYETSRLYRNEGGGVFSLLPDALGEEAISTYVSWADIDGDGDLDLALQGQGFYRNDGVGTFIVISDTASITASDMAWGDMDNDGDLDLIVPNHVYRNEGEWVFSEVSAALGSYSDIALGDVDSDGDLDIAIGTIDQVNRLYRNDGNWAFSEVPFALGSATDSTNGLAWGDMDGDGDLDLAMVNGDFSFEGQLNRLYRNDSGWAFSEVPSAFGISMEDTASVAWGDMDNDGDLDLAAGNENSVNRLYRNEGAGVFSEVIGAFGSATDDTKSVAWGDMDGDGDLDLAVGNNGQVDRLYRNEGGGIFNEVVGAFSGNSYSVAWGDVDGDDDLDLAAGNDLYRNEGDGTFSKVVGAFGGASDSVAWGDVDGDTDLDLLVGSGAGLRLYRNDGTGTFAEVTGIFTESRNSESVAWGDMDGDGDLDIISGTYADYPNELYRNDGGGIFSKVLGGLGYEEQWTRSVAWGDSDSDGDLDIVVGDQWFEFNINVNRLYHNQGEGVFREVHGALGDRTDPTRSVTWGDMDNDGDLDLAVGNSTSESLNTGSYVLLYNNPLQGNVSGLADTPPFIAVNQPYLLPGANGYAMSDGITSAHIPISYTLFDREGGHVGGVRAFYSLDGGGHWLPAVATSTTLTTNLIAAPPAILFFEGFEGSGGSSYTGLTQTVPISGALHVVFGSSEPAGRLRTQAGLDFPHSGAYAATLDRATSGSVQTNYLTFTLNLTRYEVTEDTILLDFAMMHHGEEPHPNDRLWLRGAETEPWIELLDLSAIQGPAGVYTDVRGIDLSTALLLADQKFSDQVQIRFGQEGSNPATSTIETDGYTFDNIRLRLDAPPVNKHVFIWDTFASGLFGRFDNVVFRLEAIPQAAVGGGIGTYLYQNNAAGPFMWSTTSATTLPFRIRGTQVRVYTGTVTSESELAGALVYRLPAGQTVGAGFMVNPQDNQPWRTDSGGFLQGRGELRPGDQIVALYPVFITDTYTLYHTSAPVTVSGLDMHTVTAPGVQTLTVSAENKLMAFNLDVSLEWDATQDSTFLDQLQNDVRRASQILFDLSNGQAALGSLRIYQNKENWNHAHIAIMAANNVRPGAILGGIVLTPTDDISGTIENAYVPGQVRMPPTWNRFGDPGGTIGEDWPRVLAHELGHYLLFMPDNYLGLTDEDLLTLVDCSGSAMTDPYSDAYSEFLTRAEWEQDPECMMTLAERHLGRADWQTIKHFYPTLDGTTIMTGPSNLPLALPIMKVISVTTPTNGLLDPFFSLVNENGAPLPLPSGKGHAYLIKAGEAITTSDDRLLYLGTAVGDLIHARGAAPGDELCVFDYSVQPLRQGCTTVGSVAGSIALTGVPNWEPQIRVTAYTSDTFTVTVTNLADGVYQWQLFPSLGYASEIYTQTVSGGVGGFTTTVSLPYPAYAGYLHLWMPGTTPYRMAIGEFLDLREWDGRAIAWGGRAIAWGGRAIAWGGRSIAWGAPILSSDGQVQIFTLDDIFGEGGEYTLQTLPFPPELPSWLTPVGNSYLVTSEEDPFPNSSILARYLGRDVPAGYESQLAVYFLPEGESTWERLATELDTYQNHASAAMPGPGTYALMATVQVAPFVPGWNNFGYPIQGSRPVTEALASIDGFYTSIYEYVPPQARPWVLYDTTVITPFQPLVNDLEELQFTHAYWIYATAPVTLFLGVEGGLSMQPGATEAFQLPPATYYGWLTPTAIFTPTAGMSVTAEIDGVTCGTTTVEQFGNTDQLYYVLQVKADNIIDPPDGCGLAGRAVSFRVGEHLMDANRPWANSQAWYHPLIAVMQPIDGLTATNSGPTLLGSPTYFTATVTTGTYVSYIWDFGDGSSGMGANTSHTYAAAGTYVVEVTAFNDINAMVASTEVLVDIPTYNTFLPIALKGSGGAANVLLPTSTLANIYCRIKAV